MDGSGTITWEEFLEDAERFLVVSDRISDGWEFRGDKVYFTTLRFALYMNFARSRVECIIKICKLTRTNILSM